MRELVFKYQFAKIFVTGYNNEIFTISLLKYLFVIYTR